jgi:hypothetical protein
LSSRSSKIKPQCHMHVGDVSAELAAVESVVAVA